MAVNLRKCKQLFPEADPHNLETIRKFQERLRGLWEDLEQYQEHKGEQGYWYCRGFLGSTRKTINRVRMWLKAAGQDCTVQ